MLQLGPEVLTSRDTDRIGPVVAPTCRLRLDAPEDVACAGATRKRWRPQCSQGLGSNGLETDKSATPHSEV